MSRIEQEMASDLISLHCDWLNGGDHPNMSPGKAKRDAALSHFGFMALVLKVVTSPNFLDSMRTSALLTRRYNKPKLGKDKADRIWKAIESKLAAREG